MRTVLLFLMGGILIGGLGAQEGSPAPEPRYKLIGDLSQQVLGYGPDWNSQGTPYWIFQADLKHEFTVGPAAFVADHTVYANLSGAQTGALAPQSVTTTVYEAYLRYSPAESLDLDFGKKRFNIGVGQTFTVGDSINPLTSFFDQKTGFRGVQMAWTPNQWFGWTAGLSAERNLGNDRWNPASTAAGTDLTKAAGASQVQFLLDKLQVTAALCASPNRTFNPSAGFSYDFSGVLWTAEAAWEFLPQGLRPDGSQPVSQWKSPDAWTAPAPAASTGLRYTWSPTGDLDLTFSAEYLYWSQGWTADQTQAWKDRRSALASNSTALAALTQLRAQLPVKGQHNLFLKTAFAGWQKVDLSTLFVVDLQDASGLCQGVLTFYPVEGLDLITTAQAATGSSDSAWSGLPLVSSLGTSNSLYLWCLAFQAKYHF